MCTLRCLIIKRLCILYLLSHSCNVSYRICTVGASSGACALVPFGQSSIFFSTAEAAAMGCAVSLSSNAPEMPYLKKWVRTKHAILFRLSNRTVQVLFMDRRFVLVLSSHRQICSGKDGQFHGRSVCVSD
jgi:POLO box duplicated region